MIEFKPKNIEELIKEAKAFSKFREKCKQYLEKNLAKQDKFTIVNHDSIIGYLSEKSLEQFLKEKHPDIEISSWESKFNIRDIRNIINENDKKPDCIQLVKEYFYDKYDLKLSYGNNSIHIDVKTAKTSLIPQNNWIFLYPKIQAERTGKDYVVLAYCIFDNKTETFDHLRIIGAIQHAKIQIHPLIPKGTVEKNQRPSQTDNYKTNLTDYSLSLDKLVEYLKS